MDCKQVKGVDFFIYDSLEEFISYKHLGSDVKPWRDESVKEGDYIKTDEGGVTKCLKVSFLSGKRCITTICGTYRADKNTHKMDNTPRSRYTSFVSNKEKQKKEKPLSKKDKTFARLTMLGENEIEAYKKIHPDAKSEVYIKSQISTITNKTGFNDFMDKTFAEMLNQSKMTEQWSLDNLKEIAEDKSTTAQGTYRVPSSVREKILTDNLEYHGRVKSVKQVESHTWHASSQIGEGELKEVKEIGEKTTKSEKKIEVEK